MVAIPIAPADYEPTSPFVAERSRIAADAATASTTPNPSTAGAVKEGRKDHHPT
jgi:hypothetical protein